MSSSELIELRHHLHSIAEVSGKEAHTADFIVAQLNDCNPDGVMTDVGGHGVIARFMGKENGPTILLRCELDALPIAEENELKYQSKNKGTGHKCGHDGHMAILMGVAKQLSAERPEKGEVILLFQPAEETGAGAKRVLEDDQFADISPDYVFALHNVPGFKKHQIILKKGVFAAASVGLIARFKGETAHAAHPEKGKSPVLAVAQLIQSLSAMPQFYAPLEKATKVTVIQSHIGEKAFGTSPGYGEVMATLRTYEDALLENLKTRAQTLVKTIANTYDLELETEWVESFPATVNEEGAIDIIKSSAESNDIAILEKEEPFSWSEDFGHFTAEYEGALFGLGAGTDHPALHAGNYDFPDDIIETGVSVFSAIIKRILE